LKHKILYRLEMEKKIIFIYVFVVRTRWFCVKIVVLFPLNIGQIIINRRLNVRILFTERVFRIPEIFGGFGPQQLLTENPSVRIKMKYTARSLL
jgi:hypothetical protein